MADPLDYTLVRLDDSIDDKAILAYDAKNDKIVDSGLHGDQGELTANAGTVSVGLQDMSSAGEQVVWRNVDSQVNYAPPWHVIDEVNPGGSYDRYYDPVQTATRFATRTDVLENPKFDVYIPIEEVVFQLDMTFPDAHKDVHFMITHAGHEMWSEIKDVSAGKQSIKLDIPIAFHPGTYEFSIEPYTTKGVDVASVPPVRVMGDAQTGKVGYDVVYRQFSEKKLATEEYVDAATAGGGSGGGDTTDFMRKSVYDIDGDGVVDEAKALQGAASAGNSKYYGTDSTGSLGFHDVPAETDLTLITKTLEDLSNTDVTLATRIVATDDKITALRNELEYVTDYFTFRGKVAPSYPAELQAGYFVSIYALANRLDMALPYVQGIKNGTIFFIANEDTNNSIFLRATDGSTVKGGAMVNIPPQTILWLVRDGTDWVELLAGYLPSSYQGLISDIKFALTTDLGFLKSVKVRSEATPEDQALEVSELAFDGCDVEHDPVNPKLAHIQPRLGVDFINPDGSRVNKVTEVKLVGMEIKKTTDGTPPKLILLDHQNVPQPSTASAYAFFDASATPPDSVPFQSLPVFRGGRVTVHKDTSAPQYAYILIPPGEATDAERVGELGGIPSYWSKQSKDYTVGGQQRTYTVFRSPYAFHEHDVTLVIYP